MADVYYKQCTLVKKSGKSTLTQMAWIPEKFAVGDKPLKLKMPDGTWDDHWVVRSAGTVRRLEKYLPDPHMEIKSHRKNTGDSLPKEKKCL